MVQRTKATNKVLHPARRGEPGVERWASAQKSKAVWHFTQTDELTAFKNQEPPFLPNCNIDQLSDKGKPSPASALAFPTPCWFHWELFHKGTVSYYIILQYSIPGVHEPSWVLCSLFSCNHSQQKSRGAVITFKRMEDFCIYFLGNLLKD